MNTFDIRPGEIQLTPDPATRAPDAGIVFVGRVRTPWQTLAELPKNPRQARERGVTAELHIDEALRPGMSGLEKFSHVVVLYWMHKSRRDVIVQTPKHLPEPRGVFALRSPVRPNPIAMSVVRVLRLDQAAGVIEIDAIDCLDGTPIVDIKPYLPSIDAVPNARTL